MSGDEAARNVADTCEGPEPSTAATTLDGLWDAYLQAEAKHLRGRALETLGGFIDALHAAPAVLTRAWVRRIAAEVSEAGSGVPLRYPLFRDALLPDLTAGVLADEPECARWLAALVARFPHPPPSGLPARLQTSVGLLEEAVRHDPADRVARSRLLAFRAGYLRHTLHALPSGVLYASDGATVPECGELDQILDAFEVHLRHTNEAEVYAELVAACRFHYRAYATYLASTPRPTSYASYLRDTFTDVPPIPARHAR